jgi:sialic acid synthase SpsE
MSNDKQTAVEWFKKELEDYGSNSHLSLDWNTFDELCQQAKEMEKEQIVNTWSEATAPQHEIGLSDASYVIAQIKKAEQYYNETYGGKK